MVRITRSRIILAGLALLVTPALVACQTQVMASPNLYTQRPAHPFGDVEPEFQTNLVEVLYVTDRLPVENAGRLEYRHERGAPAFGTCDVYLGRDVTWPQLVAASRTKRRAVDLWLACSDPVEISRWNDEATRSETDELFLQTLRRRLAQTGRQDVFVFVHGFNTTFEKSVTVIAQLWHFLGREGVPIAYSWPSWPVNEGGLRSYSYDYESSSFTVRHLKEFLRLLASCPEVARVHIVAHSRGADVTMTALREIFLRSGGDAIAARLELKLGIVVLAAPDLDVDVLNERILAERIHEVPQRLVIYISKNDWALRLSNWLVGGRRRVGTRPDRLPPKLQALLQDSTQLQMIDADTGSTRNLHDYFYRDPAVSSDLILLLRGHLDPGEATDRPLAQQADGVWRLDHAYPGVASP